MGRCVEAVKAAMAGHADVEGVVQFGSLFLAAEVLRPPSRPHMTLSCSSSSMLAIGGASHAPGGRERLERAKDEHRRALEGAGTGSRVGGENGGRLETNMWVGRLVLLLRHRRCAN